MAQCCASCCTMRAGLLIALVSSLVVAAKAITRDDLYANGRGLDNQLTPGDDTTSEEILLNVPITFYGTRYDSIFVNTNGLLSFRTDIPAFMNMEFPLDYPVIAPLYSNVDTTKSGTVYFRETQDAYTVLKATEDVANSFRYSQRFEPTSVFIATWSNVGYHKLGADKTNTFQVVIMSNDTDSFVQLLYPDDGIQWIQATTKIAGISDARAQAGFVGEDGRYFIMKDSGKDSIRMAVSLSNCGEDGKFIYRVGNVQDNVEEPNVSASFNRADEVPRTCSQGGSQQCHLRAQCIDNENGFCCVCLSGYYGNGKTCIKNDAPLRVNGEITGELNGELLEPINLQAYVVVSDGRSYTALSNAPDRHGYSMQVLSILGGVIGWLFAKPGDNAKNGYQLTGGVFNHTADILFPDTREKVTIRQQFEGLDVFDQLKMKAEIRGSIPKIPHGSKLEINDYEEQFTLSRPGLILSQSSRSYKNKGLLAEYPFTVEQSITYQPCAFISPEDAHLEPMNLKVAKNFLGYESKERIIRYGMSNKIYPLGQEDPCVRGRQTCGARSFCVVDGDSYRCNCEPGYQQIYIDEESICVDTNECSTGTHNCDVNAMCINQEGTFSCHCNEGYEGNGVDCRRVQSPCDRNQCDENAHCYEARGQPYCECNEGFNGDGYHCNRLSGSEIGCDIQQNCSPYATCSGSDQYGPNVCQCYTGYSGDGYTCTRDEIPEYSTYPPDGDIINADCVFSTCICPSNYQRNGELCYRIIESTEPPTTEDYEESVLSRPLPQCFNKTCTCPWTYKYNIKSNVCTPDSDYPHDTKGPSGFKLSCNVVNRCHPYAQCIYVSTTGKYQCKCTGGFEGDGDDCTEIEQTCENADICDVHASCTFDPALGKSICVCMSGYQGDGHVCSSIGCRTSDDCEENAECKFSPEYHLTRRVCLCKDGYTKDSNDACISEDESCNGVMCTEHATCHWDATYGVYYCQCDAGYQGDGLEQCTLLKQGCDTLNDCDLNAGCKLDTDENRYKCVCNSNFYGDGHKCSAEITCEHDPYLCSAQATCINHISGFVCECNPGFIGNGTFCKVIPKRDSNFLLLNQGMSTLRVPFEPSAVNPGRPIQISYYQMAIGLDVDCIAGRVYWSDITGRVIKSSNYDGTLLENFLTQDIISPEGISIDWVSRNIFWTDSRKDTVEVANIDTKVRKILIDTDLVDPRGIAVHPYKGKIFWSDWNRKSPKIEWANMDGTDRDVFVSGEFVTLPNSLAIDWDTDELCYADAGTKSIECVHIDTQVRRTAASNCTYPFGLAITPTHFYWTDWSTQKIERLDKLTNIRQVPIDVPLGGSGNKLYGMSAVLNECRSLSNLCQYDNGQCPKTHICLLNGKGGRSCECGIPAVGQQLCT